VGVTVIGVVAFLGGIFGLLGGFAAVSGFASEPLALGVVVVVFGVLGIVLGVGFLRGYPWAWKLGLIVYVLSLPLGAFEVTLGGSGSVGGVIRVVVGLAIIYYLMRPHVKAFFRKKPIASGPSMQS
jgi:uncharacterized membrane protein (DUF2068 family)